MATQVFKVTGTRNGKPFEDLAKVAGGRMTEEGLVEHYKATKHANYKDVSDLKATFVSDEEGEPLDPTGKPIPPSQKGPRPASSSSSSGAAQPGR